MELFLIKKSTVMQLVRNHCIALHLDLARLLPPSLVCMFGQKLKKKSNGSLARREEHALACSSFSLSLLLLVSSKRGAIRGPMRPHLHHNRVDRLFQKFKWSKKPELPFCQSPNYSRTRRWRRPQSWNIQWMNEQVTPSPSHYLIAFWIIFKRTRDKRKKRQIKKYCIQSLSTVRNLEAGRHSSNQRYLDPLELQTWVIERGVIFLATYDVEDDKWFKSRLLNNEKRHFSI